MTVLLEVVITISINPTDVSWDTVVFSKNNDVPLYIHDVLEVVTDNQELNISVIQI